jgi:hypothetical protein
MSTLIACAVCSGASDSLQFKGVQMGILVLLAFTGCMLAAFAAFFLHLRRRMRAFEESLPPFDGARTEGVTR